MSWRTGTSAKAVGLISRTELARDLQSDPRRGPPAPVRPGAPLLPALGLDAPPRRTRGTGPPTSPPDIPRSRRPSVSSADPNACTSIPPTCSSSTRSIGRTRQPNSRKRRLQAWRERLVKVLAGHDWRIGRPFRAQPVVRSDRRWGPRLLQPGPKPVEISAGDRVEVVGSGSAATAVPGTTGPRPPGVLVREPPGSELRPVHSRGAVDGARGIREPARSQPRTARDLHPAARVPSPVSRARRRRMNAHS